MRWLERLVATAVLSMSIALAGVGASYSQDKVVRIGGASGAWGDSPTAIPQLLTADVNYLVMDFLAEVTMSLLARARMKDANAGFPPDFVAYLKKPLLLKELLEMIGKFCGDAAA